MLFVCTGNIHRSPVAERLFASRTQRLPVDVSSAGTAGLTGHGIDAASALALRELGVDPAGHRARRLTPALIAEADLVLTAGVEHRARVVQNDPSALRRAFTMREFARLGDGLGPVSKTSTSGLRERVLEVAARRGIVPAAAPGQDDIGDPFGASLEVVRACVAQLNTAVDGIVSALGLPHARLAG